jgi:uncharacterized membrane protein YqaE (UPF0057 family)
MKTTKLLSLLLIVALAFASCKNNMSLTKRHYTKGYHLHKRKSVDQPEVKEGIASTPSKKAEKVTPIEIVEVKLTAINAPKAESKNATVNNTLTASAAKTTAPSTKKQIKAENQSLNETKHQLQSESKPAKQSANKGGGSNSDIKLIICIILAILIPPLGMYIWNKKTDTWFIVDLILFLLWASWFWIGSLGLIGLVSVIIALLRVFDLL